MIIDTPLLEAKNLSRAFVSHEAPGVTRTLSVLDNVSLSLSRGDIVGLIGESGSGKTTLARVFALIYPPSAGELLLDGKPADVGDPGYLKRHRAAVQLMFQDPFASLNPMHRVRYALERALRLYGSKARGADLQAEVLGLLEKVKLRPAADFIDKYPHQLSGGQRQRVVLARALAARPKILLADEPISMLDVSIRAEMLNLLGDLRDEEGLGVLYVTHDVASARYLCNKIAVIYAGQIVEIGETEAVIQNPQHPYTRRLLDASPDPAQAMKLTRAERFKIDGESEPPDLANPPAGCRFSRLCPSATGQCRQSPPEEVAIGPRHRVRCWNLDATVAWRPGAPES